MIVTGTYQNRWTKRLETLQLKQVKVWVKVEIPDEELIADDPVYALMRDLDAIRENSDTLKDDGVPDRDKLAKAVWEEDRYRD